MFYVADLCKEIFYVSFLSLCFFKLLSHILCILCSNLFFSILHYFIFAESFLIIIGFTTFYSLANPVEYSIHCVAAASSRFVCPHFQPHASLTSLTRILFPLKYRSPFSKYDILWSIFVLLFNFDSCLCECMWICEYGEAVTEFWRKMFLKNFDSYVCR